MQLCFVQSMRNLKDNALYFKLIDIDYIILIIVNNIPVPCPADIPA